MQLIPEFHPVPVENRVHRNRQIEVFLEQVIEPNDPAEQTKNIYYKSVN